MTSSRKGFGFVSAFLALVIALTAFAGLSLPASAASKWDGYQKISSANDLSRLSNSSGKFYLTKDIDLKNVTWDNTFTFKGTLDGNGYAIKNLTSTKCGLFNNLNGAEIKNLGLENVKINIGYGGAAAITLNSKDTSFENCYVTGSVKCTSSMAAGFSAFSSGGNTYTNCVNLAEVTSGSAASGFQYGLAWDAGYDVYKNCVNYGNISAKEMATGICTYLGTTMESCYNVGTVSITSKSPFGFGIFASGLAGRGTADADMKNCATTGEVDVGYLYNGCTAQADTSVAKNTFKKTATFKGFDFKNVWTTDSKTNSGYPVLKTMVKSTASTTTTTTTTKKYSSIKVELSTDIKGGEIRYTTDGKAPTATSKKYSSAISLTKTTNIKAAVFVNGKKQTGSNAQVYYKIVIA